MSGNNEQTSSSAVPPPKRKMTKKEIDAEVAQKVRIEAAKKCYTGVLASYLQKKAKIISTQEKLNQLTADVKRMEDEFDYLKKLNKKIHEVGRNVVGIGEGVKVVDKETKEKKRKRESLQEEARKITKIMEISEEGDNESV